jgi:preprotein translocase subunit SecD
MQIAANFTPTEAKNIAAVLGSGPLPVRFSLQSLTPGN